MLKELGDAEAEMMVNSVDRDERNKEPTTGNNNGSLCIQMWIEFGNTSLIVSEKRSEVLRSAGHIWRAGTT